MRRLWNGAAVRVSVVEDGEAAALLGLEHVVVPADRHLGPHQQPGGDGGATWWRRRRGEAVKR